jgi:hypothetical protein
MKNDTTGNPQQQRLLKNKKAKRDNLVEQLREAAKGRYFWRVQDKVTKSYCNEWEDYEKHQAEAWWNENREKFPVYHENNELARVHFRSRTDLLMLRAAAMLESDGGVK